MLDQTVNDKVAAAKATWSFKIAESDTTLHHCDKTSLLFRNLFL